MTSENTSTPESAQAAYESMLDDPFWSFGPSDAELEADAIREAAELRAVEETLEDDFAKQGLRFTKGFHGAMPVQAYGWILGQRFYFRYRHDTAVLHVGNVDPTKAQEEFEAKVNRRAKSRWEFMNPGAVSFEELPEWEKAVLRETAIENHNLTAETELSVTAYPNEVKQSVSLEKFTGDELSGFLTATEAEEVFAFLVGKLAS